MGHVRHTEDEFLRGSKHVDGESDLVLVDLQSNPADERAHHPENKFHRV